MAVETQPDKGGFEVSVDAANSPTGLSREKVSFAGDEEARSDTSDNPFSDPETAAYYSSLYEKAQYECRHVFDPNLEWSREEEKKLIQKLDWRVCLWAVSSNWPNLYHITVKLVDDCRSVSCSPRFKLTVGT